jgi:hypothetical protein
MDEKLANNIQDALTHVEDVVSALQKALFLSGATPLTVRSAKDTLSEVLNKVRSGAVHLIGKDRPASEMALVISLESFAELLLKTSTPLSFYDALYASGFEPATGEQPQLRRGNPRIPLDVSEAPPKRFLSQAG